MIPLVIGLGNPDCGDDAAGILVARGLAALGFETIAHTGSPLDLLDLWIGSERVIVIDAMVAGERSYGNLFVWNWPESPPHTTKFRSSSTHGLGLAEAVHLAATLGRVPSEMTIYGIAGRDFATGAATSSAVLAQVERVVRTIAATYAVEGEA